jgi:[NiFe] hydrogenase diaphorase moiety small subunit
MSATAFHITVDGVQVSARPGQSILQACDESGMYIPRLCYHPDLPPGGHCRLCTCKINGRYGSTCTTPAAPGMVVENNTPELLDDRRTLVELMFIEGNHFCPGCEKSGACELQAMAYRLGLESPRLQYQWTPRELDATHPEVLLDRNRCILCCRCVRASRTVDGKHVFGLEGRGIHMRIAVDSAAGLGATNLTATDKAVEVCPVACIVHKGTAFLVPFGHRRYDGAPIGAEIEAKKQESQEDRDQHS